MSTPTSIRVGVDLLTKSAVYASNCILQIAFRVEAGRVAGGHYMIDHAEVIEQGILVWLREQTLQTVTMELFDTAADQAYEKCVVELSYLADPTEEVVPPPIEELEALIGCLGKLPPDARFRFVVTTAPGATKVPGWQPTTLKALLRGVKEEIDVGKNEHGFGHIHGRTRYVISNWAEEKDEPPGQAE